MQSKSNDDDYTNTATLYKKLQKNEDGIPLVRWLVVQRLCRNRREAIEAIKPSLESSSLPEKEKTCRVTINNKECISLSQLVQKNDIIEFDDGNTTTIIDGSRPIRHVYYILNKPSGYLCSRRHVIQLKGGGKALDPRPTVYDYLPTNDRPYANSIGRLDVDTTGILFFTSDGLLCDRLANPMYKVAKTYRCTLRSKEPLSEDAIHQLQVVGVKLPHAKGAVVRGKVWNVDSNINNNNNEDTIDDTTTSSTTNDDSTDNNTNKKNNNNDQKNNNNNGALVDLQIYGGYTHQVKLMMSLIKRPLRLLHRRTFANLSSDLLREGECRPMNRKEIHHLYDLASSER